MRGVQPQPRTFHTSSAAIGARLFVFGGGDKGAEPVKDQRLHVFDTGTSAPAGPLGPPAGGGSFDLGVWSGGGSVELCLEMRPAGWVAVPLTGPYIRVSLGIQTQCLDGKPRQGSVVADLWNLQFPS